MPRTREDRLLLLLSPFLPIILCFLLLLIYMGFAEVRECSSEQLHSPLIKAYMQMHDDPYVSGAVYDPIHYFSHQLHYYSYRIPSINQVLLFLI